MAEKAKTNQPAFLHGKYELGRMLGQGTFAKVYHARHLPTGKSVAMKVVGKEKVFKEPLGGAHANPAWTSQQIKAAINESMDELTAMTTEELLHHRNHKFRKLGGFQENAQLDPKKKVNVKKKEETVRRTSNVELEGEVEKLKQQILKAKESSSKPPGWL